MPATILTAPYRSLISGFLKSVVQFPENPALNVGGDTYTYRELMAQVANIAAGIEKSQPQPQALIGVCADRSAPLFAGVLAALYSGAGYVPLNPDFPDRRLSKVIRSAGLAVIVTTPEYVARLNAILAELDGDHHLVVCAAENKEQILSARVRSRVTGPVEAWSGTPIEPPILADQMAYLLFTSGSTGEPKGIGVTHRNVNHFIDAMVALYQMDHTDRVIFLPDLTFDLSVYPLWAAWEVGAALVCVPKKLCMAPGKLIQKHAITIWCSVPSVAVFMGRLGQLKPGAYPTIRASVFCGEPFLQETINAWQAAVPNSVVDNFYGPTEVTVFSTYYRWQDGADDECVHGIVPIGLPLPGLQVTLADDTRQIVSQGEVGEICIAGPQVTPGYWRSPELTADKYVALDTRMDDNANYWYRTGDLGKINGRGNLIFVGRVDDQVQIMGYRVELSEVENTLRDFTNCQHVAVIGYSPTPEAPKFLVAYVAAIEIDIAALSAHCREVLPDYMQPKEFHLVDEMPLNQNGKINKKELERMRREHE